MPNIDGGSAGSRCILLAVRHLGLSEGIRALLTTVVPTVILVADEVSLLEAATRLQPEIAVVDLALPGRDGLGMVRRLRRRCQSVKIVLIDAHGLSTATRQELAGEVNAILQPGEIGSLLLPVLDTLLEGARPGEEIAAKADPAPPPERTARGRHGSSGTV